MKRNDYAKLLIWAAVLVSVPRYVGAFLVSDMGQVTGWLSDVLTVLNVFSGAGMGLLDVIASAYLFDAWRQTLPRLDRKPTLRWYSLTGMVLGVFAIGIVILTPYVVARVLAEPMRQVLDGAGLWVWSTAVIVAPLFIIGGVAFARGGVVGVAAESSGKLPENAGGGNGSAGKLPEPISEKSANWRGLSDSARQALSGMSTAQIMRAYPSISERTARNWRAEASALSGGGNGNGSKE